MITRTKTLFLRICRVLGFSDIQGVQKVLIQFVIKIGLYDKLYQDFINILYFKEHILRKAFHLVDQNQQSKGNYLNYRMLYPGAYLGRDHCVILSPPPFDFALRKNQMLLSD